MSDERTKLLSLNQYLEMEKKGTVDLTKLKAYSEKRHRRFSCNGKQNHRDPINALMMTHLIYVFTGDLLWPYSCKYCSNWHIGHQPNNVRQMICALLDIKFDPEKKSLTLEQHQELCRYWKSESVRSAA